MVWPLCPFANSLAVERILHIRYADSCVISFVYFRCFHQHTAQGNAFSTIFVRSTASPLSQAAMDSGIGDDRLSDELRYVKFTTIAWTKDAKGFFYQVRFVRFWNIFEIKNNFQRYPPVDDDVMNRIQSHTDRDAMVYYHFIGTPQCKPTSFILLCRHSKRWKKRMISLFYTTRTIPNGHSDRQSPKTENTYIYRSSRIRGRYQVNLCGL